MSGSQKTETKKESVGAWAPAQPALQDILASSKALSEDPASFAPVISDAQRQGAANLSNLRPEMSQGLLPGLMNRTQQGYGVGNDALMTTASGGMLGGNPYLDAVLNKSTSRAADAVNAQFSGAGRYGSGAHTGVLSDRLGAIETNARMQDYTAERNNQMNAAGILNNDASRAAQFAQQGDAANAQVVQNQIAGGTMQTAFNEAERDQAKRAQEWYSSMVLPIANTGKEGSSTTTQSQPADKLGMAVNAAMMVAGAATGNPMAVANGATGFAGSASGGPMSPSSGSMFGNGSIFGSPSPVYSQPGTAANGGWSTTATPAYNPWGGFFGGA